MCDVGGRCLKPWRLSSLSKRWSWSPQPCETSQRLKAMSLLYLRGLSCGKDIEVILGHLRAHECSGRCMSNSFPFIHTHLSLLQLSGPNLNNNIFLFKAAMMHSPSSPAQSLFSSKLVLRRTLFIEKCVFKVKLHQVFTVYQILVFCRGSHFIFSVIL